MHSILYLAFIPLALTAPLLTPRAGEVIPGKYIIKLKSDSTQTHLDDVLSKLSHEPDHIYGFGGFRGVAGKLSDAALDSLKSHSAIEFIEKDTIVRIQDYVTQNNAPWGLGRISHVNPGSTVYGYDTTAGTGTCTYVIDTGIYTAHPEFQGRATWLANFVGDGQDSDGNGHGTHVSGTIGSVTYGVAKNTQLYAVKVLDSSGSGATSGVIAGINFAANDQTTRNCPNGAVANMSLEGPKSDAENSAVANAVAAGLFMAVAAGNDNTDASNSSPASEPTACTVGASDINDAKASFSNFGSVVDIFAPGVDILSTWNDGSTNILSGTSMATPHITGLAAFFLGYQGKINPGDICGGLQKIANQNRLSGIPSGTVNSLAFNGNIYG